jgi:hypothetical protein
MTLSVPILLPAKSVNSVLDYGLNWSAWLQPGDSIVSFSITANSSDLTISAPVMTIESGEIIISSFIGGGQPGTSYYVYFSVTTANGRTDIESAILNVLHY